MEEHKNSQNHKQKGTFWSGFFGMLDKLHLKKATTRKFIFKPPKNAGEHISSF